MMWTEKEEVSLTGGRPDQDLVMIGYMALDGSARVAEWEQAALCRRLPMELLEDLHRWNRRQTEALAELTETTLRKWGASAWYPVADGGVFNALWHMADHWGTGFTVQLKEIPVRQESIEVCELQELNPYYLWSGHCLLAASDHGQRLCDSLKAAGLGAAVIGLLTDTKDKALVHDDTTSYLNRPREDELKRYEEAISGNIM